MDLRNLIETHLDIDRLAKDLDEIGHSARVWSVRQWSASDMATLWDAAKSFRPVGLDDFVPPSIPSLTQVIHEGQSSLPAFTQFQKRFCRPSDPAAHETLVGYNHQSLSSVTGPGYYVARPSTDPGEVDIDYTMLPKEKPREWPDIQGNDALLGRFVYHRTIEVMRGVSTHVSMGRAKRNGQWRDHWFILVRRDPSLPS
ncbi:MAG: hypothetical protein M3O46_07260 [Myxococcota bacterium]|nr:hypothetical protein [Myxococcota bacterium]